MKNIKILSLATLALLAACRPDIAEKNTPSIIESYSPGYVRTDDTVSVIGQFLDGASVYVGSEKMSLIKNTSNEIQFMVPNVESNPITVNTANASHTFSTNLIINHMISIPDKQGWLLNSPQSDGEILRGPKQLLITDFDGAGIRVADATNRFDETKWTSVVRPTGAETIANNYLGISSDLGKGNYYALTLADSTQVGDYGFVGELTNRSDLLNGNIGSWASNFSAYPNSPITKDNSSELDDLYLNFALFNNGFDKSLLRIYLKNDFISDAEGYRGEVPVSEGKNEWVWVSLPLDQFKKDHGSKASLELDGLYESINIFKFVFTHDGEKDVEIATGKGEGEVQFMIDHIILTQGAPYFGQP